VRDAPSSTTRRGWQIADKRRRGQLQWRPQAARVACAPSSHTRCLPLVLILAVSPVVFSTPDGSSRPRASPRASALRAGGPSASSLWTFRQMGLMAAAAVASSRRRASAHLDATQMDMDICGTLIFRREVRGSDQSRCALPPSVRQELRARSAATPAVTHSGPESPTPVYMIGELTATLTATRSTISPSTKIITHDHPPNRDHGEPWRIPSDGPTDQKVGGSNPSGCAIVFPCHGPFL
jgi:hypothetical protein